MQQLEAYLSTLRPNSRAPYRQAFYEFQKFLKERELWLNETGMNAYLAWLKEKRLSGKTINLKFDALRSIYRHFARNGHTNKNPFENSNVRLPRSNWNRKRHYRLIPFDKVTRVCTAPSNHTKVGIRDRCLLSILFGCGLRKDELLKLRLKDFQQSEGGHYFLYLPETKAQTDQMQSIPDWALSAILRLIEIRKGDGATESSHLLCMYRGDDSPKPGGIPTRTFDRIFKKWCAHVGVKHVSPHCARATAISKLFFDRVELKKVRDFARHASILTTELYDKRLFGIEESAGKKLHYDEN